MGATDGPSPADSDDPEVVRQHARYVDVNQRIEARDFRDERPERERSPSPPGYDARGARTNTQGTQDGGKSFASSATDPDRGGW